jgi:arginine deiminase
MTLRIDSEIGRLRTVLVHEPGREIDRMVPSMMQDLLFDDILFGARAREEHRRFRQVLKYVADEVLEARDLLEEVLQDPDARNAVLTELSTLLAWPPAVLVALNDLSADRLAAGLVEGIDTPHPEITGSLDSLYLLPPVPNWFFQRDPAVVLGDRVIRSAMATRARWREPLLSGAIFAFHPRFGRRPDAFWFREFAADERSLSLARMRPTLEGGDVLVLSPETLLIGYSERTEKITVERLAESLRRERSAVKRILVVAIPPQRATMHLDTIFTRISEGECLCHGPMILAGGAEEVDVYEADLTGREVSWTAKDDLLSALKTHGIDLEPILCGGADPIDQQREQWTDGANLFALAPGLVLGYERNTRTAEELSRHGYAILSDDDLLLGRRTLERKKKRVKQAILMSAPELSRARGGPRCMTMPLARDPV